MAWQWRGKKIADTASPAIVRALDVWDIVGITTRHFYPVLTPQQPRFFHSPPKTPMRSLLTSLALLAFAASASAQTVSINEVMADNRTAVANGPDFPDYVELKNTTVAAIDLTGWTLTDDTLTPAKYAIPSGTMLGVGAYLVIWCDSNTLSPGLHAGFKLGANGGVVALYQSGTQRDAVTYGIQAPDLSIGRVVDGTGAFTLVIPSAAATNVAKTPGAVSNLKLNEWLASSIGAGDWFEIYNADANPVLLTNLYLGTSSTTRTNTRIPALSYISGKGFTQFLADLSTAGQNHCNFTLSGTGESLYLTNTDGTTALNTVTFGAQTKSVSEGRFPDGAGTSATGPWTSFPISQSPGETNYLPSSIVINEALTNSSAPFEDAIEIYNPTASAVNIGGWWLSDEKAVLKKFQIPAGTTIAAGGFKVFYELQFNPAPGVGNSFSLSSTGDFVVLSEVDAGANLNSYRAVVKFGSAADNVSFGRVAVGGGAAPEFWPMLAHTFGQDNPFDLAQFRTGTGSANSQPKTTPIVINELMYHPPDLSAADNVRDEFIELHNITTSAVDVSGWKIKGNADFVFPAGTSIRPGDYVLVVGFDPAIDTTSLAGFRTAYSLGMATRIYGPFVPKLPNSLASVELAYPGVPVAGVTPFINVDKVEYQDGAPWPTAPDGTGPSLQRLSRIVIGNDVANWSSVTATPGAVNTGETAIADSDGDGMPDSYEVANGFDKFNAADATQDTDGDGQSNVAEYIAGTNPRDPASALAATATSAGPGSGVMLQFTAKANKSYTIQYKDTLTAATWLKLVDVPAQGTDRVVQQSDNPAIAQRFYRVITPQQ